jgi:lauroyl/myristoyl acyltransferase
MRRVLYHLLGLFGPWAVTIVAAVVSATYFLIQPRRTRECVRFYQSLFPDRSLLFHIALTWRQYQSFSRLFSERLELRREGRITYESKGWDYLEEAARDGTGGVILMSHFGSWEAPASMFQARGLPMMLYMRQKAGEKLEGVQKEDIQKDGLRIVAVPEEGSSPFDILEGLNFIKGGGFVSLAADQGGQEDRKVSVPFAGKRIRLPDTPYLLSALSGVPLFVFFSYRIGRRRYRFEALPPVHLRRVPRRERRVVIVEAATEYASMLEAVVRRHPEQWYHFDPVLEAEHHE